MLIKLKKLNQDGVSYGKVSQEKNALVQTCPPTHWTKEESHLSEFSLKTDRCIHLASKPVCLAVILGCVTEKLGCCACCFRTIAKTHENKENKKI